MSAPRTRYSSTGNRETNLVGEDERSQKYALAGPLLEGDLEVRLRPVDVDEGHEEDGDPDLGFGEDVGHKVEKVGVGRVARDRTAPGGGRWPAHGVVDSLCYAVHDVF